MHVLVTGAAGFIGMHVARAPPRCRRPGHRRGQFRSVLRRRAEGRRGLRSLAHGAGIQVRAHGSRRRRRARPGCSATADSRTSSISRRSRACAIRSTNPAAYLRNNLDAFGHVLEGCRHAALGASRLRVELVASTAPTTRCRFREDQSVDHPVSLYAATKNANELMAYSYSHLFRLPATGLRFFTVYGPWGRPDMAPMLFTRAILAGEPIQVFNDGRMRRDFTYVDDIVEGVVRVARPSARAPRRAVRAARRVQHRQSRSGRARDFIATLERLLGRAADQANTCRCSRATCPRPTPRSTACRR